MHFDLGLRFEIISLPNAQSNKSMLDYNELKPGTIFILDNQPWKVLEYNFVWMQKRKPLVQTKIRNLINGKIVSKTFSQGESLEEAGLEEEQIKFIYEHRGKYIFSLTNQLNQRIEMNENQIGETAKYLKPGIAMKALCFDGKIIKIKLPVKMDFKVVEAPPSVKGNTASGGLKVVKIETGATIKTPLFIEVGDVIRVNTQTGDYAERISKG